jgi:hypothetical protein
MICGRRGRPSHRAPLWAIDRLSRLDISSHSVGRMPWCKRWPQYWRQRNYCDFHGVSRQNAIAPRLATEHRFELETFVGRPFLGRRHADFGCFTGSHSFCGNGSGACSRASSQIRGVFSYCGVQYCSLRNGFDIHSHAQRRNMLPNTDAQHLRRAYHVQAGCRRPRVQFVKSVATRFVEGTVHMNLQSCKLMPLRQASRWDTGVRRSTVWRLRRE